MLGRRVAIDGSLTDTFSIGDGTLSSVVWDGFRYAAAFTLNSDVFATHVGTGDRLKSDVAEGAVAALGTVAVRHGGRVALTTAGPCER